MSENGRLATTLESSSFRQVMSKFATGVVVLTVGGQTAHGMTANAFSSVSLEPPLILCCVAHNAFMHENLLAQRRFAVSIMAAGQRDVAGWFADKARPRGAAQFDRVAWRAGRHTGAPLLLDSLAWLECELTDAYEAGDHSIFVGTVLDSAEGSGRDGLLFFSGQYQPVAGPLT